MYLIDWTATSHPTEGRVNNWLVLYLKTVFLTLQRTVRKGKIGYDFCTLKINDFACLLSKGCYLQFLLVSGDSQPLEEGTQGQPESWRSAKAEMYPSDRCQNRVMDERDGSRHHLKI